MKRKEKLIISKLTDIQIMYITESGYSTAAEYSIEDWFLCVDERSKRHLYKDKVFPNLYRMR